jgi:hypothetical protein
MKTVCLNERVDSDQTADVQASPLYLLKHKIEARTTRGLTLPSRGRFPAYGLQSPLMSNVRRHNRPPRSTHPASLRLTTTVALG